MESKSRKFKLLIWGFALGYFAFYLPYSALIRISTKGLLPGVSPPVSGQRMLPSMLASTAVTMALILWLTGWWRYAARRRVLGLSIPFPERRLALSGVGMAVIVATTGLAYGFSGVSILFTLLMLRGGVVMLAPAVDLAARRRVRWFSWAAVALCLLAVLLALSDVNNYRLTAGAVLNIGAYLVGYMLRLPVMSRLAKCDDRETTYRYLAGEQLIAIPLLIAVPALAAAFGWGEAGAELRLAFARPWESSAGGLAIIIGVLYAGLCVCGTLIYLDRREHTFCIPLNRGSSVLAVTCASLLLTWLGEPPPSAAQLGGAAIIIVALALLSPLHHARHYVNLYRRLKRLAPALSARARELAGRTTTPPAAVGDVAARGIKPAPGEEAGQLPQGLLFICGGNTCRSPMAAAIGRAELAARLKVPFEELDRLGLRVASAGVSARVGDGMTPESVRALRLLNVPVSPHVARAVTTEMIHEAQLIFCMTAAHRRMVVELVPAAAGKTFCLDSRGDIEEPAGSGPDAYVSCARRIHGLLKLRLDQFAAGALSQA